MVFFIRKEKVDVIFAGLGNPGAEYERTKHNVGFRAVDVFALEHITHRKFKSEIGALTIKGKLHGHDFLLAKPQNYMNDSGSALKWLSRKYPSDEIVIIYDDMDLPPGRIRLSHSGSSAGHKGMQSIINSLRRDDIKRIRIGIGGRGNIEGGEYVLTPFSGDDALLAEKAIASTVLAMEDILIHGFDKAMNKFNRKDIDNTEEGTEQLRIKKEMKQGESE